MTAIPNTLASARDGSLLARGPVREREAVPASPLDVLNAAADEVVAALAGVEDWGLTGVVNSQYNHDIVADSAALAVLLGAGFGVFSEESGLHHPERPVLVVIDPVDGSTNASHGLPWWAVSLCAMDESGPLAAVVYGVPTGERFEAVRGQGARCNGVTLKPSVVTRLDQAVLAFNGHAPVKFGWGQYRAFGSAALELCLVASGALDGFVDFSGSSLAPWDYLGAALVCNEAGAVVGDAFGRDLDVRGPGERRAVIAANGAPLFAQLVQARVTSGK